MMSTSEFWSWSASWAGDRSLPQSPATRIAWHIAQVQSTSKPSHEGRCMNNVIAESVIVRISRDRHLMPVFRSGSALPTNVILPAPSATAIRLARIVSPWIK